MNEINLGVTEDMTEEEIENYELIKSLNTPSKEVVQGLHERLFPEAYDMMGDSVGDAKMRRHGQNPMSKEYTDKVNTRRRRLGFPPLGNDGLPPDISKELQYCTDLISGKQKYRPGDIK